VEDDAEALGHDVGKDVQAAAMGHAEADDLGLESGTLYDPMVNYDRVEGKWFDWDYDGKPQAVSTRTVDTPAQNAKVDAAQP